MLYGIYDNANNSSPSSILNWAQITVYDKICGVITEYAVGLALL